MNSCLSNNDKLDQLSNLVYDKSVLGLTLIELIGKYLICKPTTHYVYFVLSLSETVFLKTNFIQV